VAVVTHLVRSVSDDLRSPWFLEVGFGPCAVPKVPEFNAMCALYAPLALR